MTNENNLRGVITDKQVHEMRQRNEQRVQEAKDRMGERYSHHPANHVERKTK